MLHMKAFHHFITALLITGCVSVHAHRVFIDLEKTPSLPTAIIPKVTQNLTSPDAVTQDVPIQTSPIIAKEIFKRQFTAIDFGFSPAAAWYQDKEVLSSVVYPKSQSKSKIKFEDEYKGPSSAVGFTQKSLTAALVNFDYLGTANANYKIGGEIEQLESSIEPSVFRPDTLRSTARIAYRVIGPGISKNFLIISTGTISKTSDEDSSYFPIWWGQSRRQAIEINVKKFLAELSTEGQGSIFESIVALNKTPTPQSNERVSANSSAAQQPPTPARFTIQANATKPDTDGSFFIFVQTGANTVSLTVDEEEQGASEQGSYTVRRLARVGQANIIKISAVDPNGNTDTKTISVVRQAVDSRPAFARLTPDKIKPRPARDAVAIIIGIQNYKLIPKAEYASQDAQDFYDYATRALGIQQENIKLLVDDEADVSGIYKAFQNWLPLKVRKGKTDVYVFYSGHGLPSADGKSLYFLPVGADRDLIAKTAISQKEIVDALKSAQPKSVTMFIDSCYSGQIRTGETLLASARPVVLTVQETAYPPDFTVITASASDQIASSSPDLKHGIFSYYLMKGLEGEADENKDGTITIGKLQSYLAERVPRFAMTMSRKQEPQLTGDANRVLVTR